MARKYKVQGTNDFKYASIIFFCLCAWFIRDGWFPPEKWIEKYGQPPETFLSVAEFWGFNRIGAILWFISGVVCAYIHRLVR